MSEVSYDVFLSEVIPYVRDVPEMVALQAVRNAAIQFCEMTRVLQLNLEPMDVTQSVSKYEFDPPIGYKIVDIMEAWFGDQLLIPKPVEEITRIYRTSNWNTLDGNPYYYFRDRTQEVQLVPMPKVTETGKLKIRASISPVRASTTVDSELYERYFENIAMGARARLCDTPNQPYYDPKSAQTYLKRFSDAMTHTRTSVAKGLTRSAVQIEFQRFV